MIHRLDGLNLIEVFLESHVSLPSKIIRKKIQQWIFRSLFSDRMAWLKCRINCYPDYLFHEKSSPQGGNPLHHARIIHRNRKGQYRSAEFYDQGTILRSNTNSRNRFADSLHQPQTLKLHHPYKFHLLEGLEPCTFLNVWLALLYGRRSVSKTHICVE